MISGVYDLEPVLSISVNQEIRLRAEQVAPMSPLRLPTCQPVRLVVAVGAAETQGFISQSEQFANHCTAQGGKTRYLKLDHSNHYTVMHHLESPQGELSRVVGQDFQTP